MSAVPPEPALRGFASQPPGRLRTSGAPRLAARRDAGGFPLKRALLTGLLLAPLALFSGAYSLAVTLDTREPQVSQSFYSELPKAKVQLGDLAIAGALGDLEAGSENAPQSFPSAADLAARLPDTARLSIERQALSGLADTPYASGSLRQLAFVETDPARRRTLLDLSRRVSRRDLSTAAQIAEAQFLDGALEEGLATLTSALTISDRLDERIFPLMLNATRASDFEVMLRATLARDPDWSERLAAHASSTPASAPLFARIANAFPEDSRARSLDYGSQLVDRLATSFQPGAAFAAYRAYSDGPQDAAAFGTRPLAPLDWRLIDSLDVGSRRIGAGGKVVEIFASPRRSGEVARIMLALEPGEYALAFRLADPRGTGAMLTLERACLTEGRELALNKHETSLDAARVTLPVSVPADCPYQSLRLGIEGSNEAVSVLVDEVTFGSRRGSGGGSGESAS